MSFTNMIYSRQKNPAYISNLVSLYRFENNVLDSKGTNNGIATNITYSAGLINNSADFNGSSSFVGIAKSSSLNLSGGGFSIAFSVFKISTGVDNTFISCRDANNRAEYQISYADAENTLNFQIFSGGNVANGNILSTDNVPMPLNTWINYVFTYNGLGFTADSMKIYKNGILASTGVGLTGTFTAMANTTSRLVLGKHGYSGLAKFQGKMDEVAVFNRELTQSEVAVLNNRIINGKSIIQ